MTDFNEEAADAIALCARTHHIEHAREPALQLAMVDFLQQAHAKNEHIIQFWWCDQLVKVDIDDQIYSTFFYFAHEQNGHMPLVRALVSMNIGNLAEIRKEIKDIAVQAMDAAMNEAELSRIAIQANFSGVDQAGLPEEQRLQHARYSHA
jgi:hypothetical protein